MTRVPQGPPFNRAALVFAVLSVPLAFIGHLVSLAVVVGLLAIVLGATGLLIARMAPARSTAVGLRRARWALILGVVGTACAVVMWMLHASNALF